MAFARSCLSTLAIVLGAPFLGWFHDQSFPYGEAAFWFLAFAYVVLFGTMAAEAWRGDAASPEAQSPPVSTFSYRDYPPGYYGGVSLSGFVSGNFLASQDNASGPPEAQPPPVPQLDFRCPPLVFSHEDIPCSGTISRSVFWTIPKIGEPGFFSGTPNEPGRARNGRDRSGPDEGRFRDEAWFCPDR